MRSKNLYYLIFNKLYLSKVFNDTKLQRESIYYRNKTTEKGSAKK